MVACARSRRSNWLLVNNDFHDTKAVFELFDGLEVKDLNIPVSSSAPLTNGTNGTHKETNGVAASN